MLRISRSSPTRDNRGRSVAAQVRVAEHLGDRTYLYVELPGQSGTLTVCADPGNPLHMGDTAHLVFPAGSSYLFDPQGRTLPAPAQG